TVIALQKRAAMQGAQSAKPIGASGHEPRQKAEYMTAPDFKPEPLKNALQRGGRPYMTPRESSSGGKTTKLGISRQGERRLRSLLALGASTIMRGARANTGRATEWQR